MLYDFMKNICPFISMIISLAHPLKRLVGEGRAITTTKRVGSTWSLFAYIFTRCTFAGLMGVYTKVIIEACAVRFPVELDAIEDFVEDCRELCRDLVFLLITGNRRKSSPEVYFPLEVPQEVMGEIGKRLPSRLDILWFRSVCKEWRSSLPCPTRFPLLVPPPPNCDPRAAYFITEVTLYSISGRSRRNAVEFEEMDRDGKFRGIYNFTNTKCDKPMTWFMDRQRSKISLGCKGHRLRKGLPRMDSHQERVEGRWDLAADEIVINKMVLISSNGVDEGGIHSSYARLSDMSAVALLSCEGMKGRLALLRLQGPPENWHWDTHFCTQVFKAIGTYRGQLCTLDQLGRVFLVDYASLQMTQVGPPLPFLPCAPLPELCTSTRRFPQKELYEYRGLLHAVDFEQFYVGRPIVGYTLSLQHDKWIDIVRPASKRGYRIYYVT